MPTGYKAKHHKPYGLLQPTEVPARRWSDVSMDFIVQLPMNQRGHDAIMVVVDSYSKRAHFIPTTTDASSKHFQFIC